MTEKIGPQSGQVLVEKQTYENLKRDCQKGWLCCYCIYSLSSCPNGDWRATVKAGENTGGIQKCPNYKPSPDWNYVREMEQVMKDSDIKEGI